jgi:bacterioferritin-associated ferredoxin
MIVCSCNVLSDEEVRTVAGTVTRRTLSSVYVCLRCRVRCGRCAGTIREIMDEELEVHTADGCGRPHLLRDTRK